MDSKRGRSSKDVGTSSVWLGFGNSEDFDLVDPEKKADNKKQPFRPDSRMTVDLKSNRISSSSGTSSGTTASTTGTINYSSFPPPYSAAGNPPASLASSSSRYSWIDSTSQNYISPSTSSTSTMRSACSLSSTASSSDSASTTSSGKHDSLKQPTPEEGKKDRNRKDQICVASRAYRERKREQQAKLDSTVASLSTKNAQLLAQQTTLQREIQEVKSKLEMFHATRSISITCPYCESACELQRQQGNEDLLGNVPT